MKAILTIEVPDDFKKGNGWKCKLAPTNAIWCVYLSNRCNAENCPLEIQEVRTPEVIVDIGWSKYDGC